ncbi:glycine cleavage system T protein [Plectosphaerella cucumerina]|uniref:Aminomethyltransferase n=1 Tax=Plectosphaerella cucumerina TaxID=40658 RepID=A0A8K0X4P9_9PEZI|nr:glycine cleavage system T protein [Plectosphaerella cucumerina]
MSLQSAGRALARPSSLRIARLASQCLIPSIPAQARATPCPRLVPASTTVSPSQRRWASSSKAETLSRTPLYEIHQAAGAKLVPFAGFAMPLEYPGQSHQESHHWTRNSASLFDVSHMVQHRLSGPLAETLLMTVTPSSIDALAPQTSSLSTLLNENGGIVDDTVITRTGPDSFYFVTNAACRDGDLAFLRAAIDKLLDGRPAEGQIQWDILEHHGLLALQGPKAAEVLQPLVAATGNGDEDLSTLYFGQSRQLSLRLGSGPGELSPPLLISRTGYTGEDGFEISIPATDAESSREASSAVARLLLGDGSVVRWAGLAARDSLRLEAGMCLYGHDINETTTPGMGGLGWVVGKARRAADAPGPQFNGQSAVLAHLEKPGSMPERRVGFLVDKGPVAREGAPILDIESGETIGRITSGCPSPSLAGQNIAMGMIKTGSHKRGTQVAIKVRSKTVKAQVAKLPFIESRFHRPS